MKSKIFDYQKNFLRISKPKLTLLVALLITTLSFAQQGINYKALIKDDLGNVITNQTIGVQFQIRSGATNGTTVYEESHTTTTDDNGLVILNIGEGTPISATFSAIDWTSAAHFLNVQVNTGAGLVDISTTQFMAVPYALSAANAATQVDDLTDGKSDTNGSSLFIGIDAGLNDDSTGNENIGIGFNALKDNTTGYRNTANGNRALIDNTTGFGNTANGFSALANNTTGFSNTANGFEALVLNTTGFGNSVNGRLAMFNNTTGNSNVALGYFAGFSNVTGSANVFIGYDSGGTAQDESNKLYINNESSNNPLIYGEFDNDLIRINGTFEVTEEINTDVINTEEINTATTGNANMIPIAYGIVESTGNILSGTGNFTAFLSGNVFVIDVNNTESLSYNNTVCLITPISTSPRTASTVISDGNGDNDADLNVRIFNSTGTQVLTTFQFVIYKL